jgi:protein-S-isoprenylcysteine O-methyltransferase Ste14
MTSIVSPIVADIMLWLMYITLAVAIGVTLLSVVKRLRLRTKDDEIINGVPQKRVARTVALAFVACLVITFLTGSSNPVTTNGQLFTDTFWLKVTDMFIYTTIILIIGCFVGVVVSRFRN